MNKRNVLPLMLLVLFFPAVVSAQSKKTVTPANKGGLQASMTRGKLVYEVNCLSCHQADGGGVPNLNPPLIQTPQLLGSKAALIQVLLKGSRGQVEIDGERFHNTMPAQAHLTDQQIADVLTYVRNSFGNKASAVTPAEVAAARLKNK